jgi:hypothetical protein
MWFLRATLVFSIVIVVGCVSVPPRVAVPEAPATQKVAVDTVSTPSPEAEPTGTAPTTSQAAKKPGSVSAEDMGIYRAPEEARAAPTDMELKVVASAKLLLGKAPNARVAVNGRDFVLDCIGTVSAIYYRVNIDVTKDFAKYSGNGVNRFYMSLKDLKVLHKDSYPRPGDAIIWDNTWDANGDGDRTDDLRTHAGIVLAVDDDGTIYYIHENLYKGVMIETMNLLHPDQRTDSAGKVINSGMAIATVSGGPNPTHWLAGDVFGAFGDVLGAADHFAVALSDDPSADEAPEQSIALAR